METLDDIQGRATISVDEAARVLGIGRNQAYVAARKGELPTLRLGRRLLVPVPKLLSMLGPSPASPPNVSADERPVNEVPEVWPDGEWKTWSPGDGLRCWCSKREAPCGRPVKTVIIGRQRRPVCAAHVERPTRIPRGAGLPVDALYEAVERFAWDHFDEVLSLVALSPDEPLDLPKTEILVKLKGRPTTHYGASMWYDRVAPRCGPSGPRAEYVTVESTAAPTCRGCLSAARKSHAGIALTLDDIP